MDIQILRRETEADHLAVESTVDLMRDDLTPAHYIATLQRFYAIVSAWEGAATAAAPAWLQPTLSTRNRAPLIEQDLAHFNAAPNIPTHPLLPDISSLPKLLGAMYVMEGSTLGGQFIARHVEKVLHLDESTGIAYFRGHGPNTGAMWKEFADIIRTRIPDTEAAAAVQSAKAMFAAFGSWMRETPDQHVC